MNAAWQKFIPWKRWVGGEGEFDGTGLRDVVNANAISLDNQSAHLIAVDDREARHYIDHEKRISALERAPGTPFPFGDA